MPTDNEVPNNGCGQYNAGSMHCSSPFGSQSILFRLPSAPPWAQPGVVRSPATYRWIIQPSLLAPVPAPKSNSLRLHCFPSECFQQVGIFLSTVTAEFYVDRVRQAVHYQGQNLPYNPQWRTRTRNKVPSAESAGLPEVEVNVLQFSWRDAQFRVHTASCSTDDPVSMATAAVTRRQVRGASKGRRTKRCR